MRAGHRCRCLAATRNSRRRSDAARHRPRITARAHVPRRGRFTRPQVKKQTHLQRKRAPGIARADQPAVPAANRTVGTVGQSVLVIDDDSAVLPLTVYYLATCGYRILTARSGAEGLAIAHDERPDLVIVGARLSDLPGTELLRRLRLPGPAGAAGAPHESVAVLLLLTGDGDWTARQTERLDALALGADDVLAPPFDVQELMLRAAAILRRVRGAPGRSARCVRARRNAARARRGRSAGHGRGHTGAPHAHGVQHPPIAGGACGPPAHARAARRCTVGCGGSPHRANARGGRSGVTAPREARPRG